MTSAWNGTGADEDNRMQVVSLKNGKENGASAQIRKVLAHVTQMFTLARTMVQLGTGSTGGPVEKDMTTVTTVHTKATTKRQVRVKANK